MSSEDATRIGNRDAVDEATTYHAQSLIGDGSISAMGCPPKVDAPMGCPPKIDAPMGCPPKIDAPMGCPPKIDAPMGCPPKIDSATPKPKPQPNPKPKKPGRDAPGR